MKEDMVTYFKCPRQPMRTTWTLPLRFFREGMLIDKEEEDRSDRVAHTVGQGQRDRMAAGNAIP